MGLVARYLEFGAIAKGNGGGAEVGEGAFGIARFAEFAALSWRSNRCVSPFVVFNNPL